jgi:glutaredoxin 3
MEDVKIYSTPSCPYCKMAKEFLNSKGIEYQDIDVSENRDSLDQMISISGQMGVPVITIGSEVIRGFDREKIESLIS